MTMNIFFNEKRGLRNLACRLGLSFAFLLLMGLSASAENITNKLEYMREIERCEQKSAVAAVRLDKTVYARIGGFREIRVISGENSEVPFRTRLSRTSKTKVVKTSKSAKIISLKRLVGNKIEIIVKNSDDKRRPVSLTIRARNRDYDKKISVFASVSPSGEWSPCGAEQSIFDYSAIIALSNNTVNLSGSCSGRFYKIAISNFSESKRSKRMELIRERRSNREFSEIKKETRFNENLKIDAVVFNYEKRISVERTPVRESAESAIIANSVRKKNTVVVLETYRQPIVRMTLDTPSINFTRGWELFSSDNRKNWTSIASGQITKIRIGNYEKTAMTLNFPENRGRYLKLVARNLDAPPIEISAVECFRNAYLAEFIVPAAGGSDLKLYYGGDVPEPRYDIDAILAGISTNAAPLFLRLGSEKPNPQYNSEKKAESFWNSEVFMYSVIGVVCVFLVVLLFSGFRKISDVPDGD
ncbi:MAG: DUF3999 domain-containing protein [Kiritimatiellaeota bacterium]|nr:DUF3999 domain-containing protein [Kiritimatiellota bacterium]